MKTENTRFLSILLYLLLIISLVGCNSLNDSVDCGSDQFYGYVVPVPPSASSVQESCSNGLNPTYRAIYTIPAADLPTLQQATYISSISEWQTSVPEGSGLRDEAAQATSLLYGTYSDGAILLDVLIDTSSDEQYKVYVVSTNVD